MCGGGYAGVHTHHHKIDGLNSVARTTHTKRPVIDYFSRKTTKFSIFTLEEIGLTDGP
jgi:hypothetical protein